ncbi:MAG: hypothetical protein NT055_08150 [Nitrospirae bacterium]|nr:hypothetical protein [Nitrospirota bacterium]
MSIMVTEQIIGARTGPTHAMGIRNRISHVNNEGGQFNRIFNHT